MKKVEERNALLKLVPKKDERQYFNLSILGEERVYEFRSCVKGEYFPVASVDEWVQAIEGVIEKL